LSKIFIFLDGLLILDSCDDERENFDKERISIIDTITNYNCDSKHQNGLSNLNYLSLKELSTNNSLNFKQQNGGISSSKNNNILLQQQPSLYLDTAKLLISLLHAWDNDESVDDIAINSLKLSRPKIPLCFGTISKGLQKFFTISYYFFILPLGNLNKIQSNLEFKYTQN